MIVRKIDKLGKIVIPMEIRNALNIRKCDPLEFFVNGADVMLRKYEPGCVFCNNVSDNLTSMHGQTICKNCIKELKEVGGR